MTGIVAVISTGSFGPHAALAREALRKAAQRAGQGIAVELRTKDSVTDPLPPEAVSSAGQVLLVAEPDGADADEARFAGRPTARATLADVLEDAPGVLARAEGGDAAPAAAPAATGALKIVAITSCPTGIAHTFMAAEGLVEGARAQGHQIRVETQGSVGAQDELTPAEIAAADLVIIAADKQVELSRFGGKRVFFSPTKPAITDGAGLIRKAQQEARVQAGSASAEAAAPDAKKVGVYKHLMTGVSFMLPFVVAGGLLIAIAFALGGIYVYEDQYAGTLGHTLFQIGANGAFTLMVPALAGYIAWSIADRPGLAPGMTGGVIAGTIGAGFLGGIVAGFIAGYGVLWLNRAIRLPKTLQGLKPVLILPLLGAALTGLMMFYVVGEPTARLLAIITEALQGMQGSSAAALGLLIGGMMAVDMGGPVNKAAYAFATTLIAANVLEPMAAVMCAGMVPPIALAVATRIIPGRFTPEEREAGNAAFVLGLAFVTEGAIPFAARDPLRVIPSLIAGSAVAGGICMALGVAQRVPHGGIFVLPIPNAVSNLVGFGAALVAGTAVTVLALALVKRRVAVPAKVPAVV
ncbi:fructose-specific PTS transporter subunit EIIC [Cereibacter azotoformans]|uniref:protein-N(pi)-phosphohistidine--D-fructose phosphotransferase n=1 Tax=Cereibacter azotoformans TaxID=43057 RepID=A0A2T5K6X4_9RHOB|nr:PTS fructose transporter subunit EIIBC [Cereibacter azotoformans]AXQ92837.1 PTS fructose transporter subunit EIIBC [Cereibacter sphaeroides]MBO4169497.1 PTS fructose transporter subunit EIIBC [Cereibacter azotoformans]PTR18174.1 PTS system D-fructose-specific IIB component (F1P-forming) (Frc family) /PTS system D-fructose-specific IIC component (F1P-forming) (Frc family) [Cereibacter azotoformans]UIJ31120.1 fructose-specific PTS transporter subunit EIIC [Cereibacter azotoformans]